MVPGHPHHVAVAVGHPLRRELGAAVGGPGLDAVVDAHQVGPAVAGRDLGGRPGGAGRRHGHAPVAVVDRRRGEQRAVGVVDATLPLAAVDGQAGHRPEAPLADHQPAADLANPGLVQALHQPPQVLGGQSRVAAAVEDQVALQHAVGVGLGAAEQPRGEAMLGPEAREGRRRQVDLGDRGRRQLALGREAAEGLARLAVAQQARLGADQEAVIGQFLEVGEAVPQGGQGQKQQQAERQAAREHGRHPGRAGSGRQGRSLPSPPARFDRLPLSGRRPGRRPG